MRQLCLLLTALFGTAVPALAQVTVDLHALDALPGARPAGQAARGPASRTESAQRRVATTKPAKPSPEPATEAPTATASVTTASPAPATAPAASTPSTATPPPATLPTAPPPTVALAPVAPPPPAAQAAPPPPPPISDSAASAATTTGAGLRVTFGAGRADLSPASAAAIKDVVRVRAQPATTPASTWWPMPPARRTIPPPRAVFRCRAPWRCAAR